MDEGRDFIRNFYFAACFCIHLQPHLAFVNQPKALVESGSYHTVITTPKDMCVKTVKTAGA
jgi:hypothetical protein